MIFDVRADLLYRFAAPAQVLLLIEAADHPAQTVRAQSLSVEPVEDLVRKLDPDGRRRAIFTGAGDVRMTYRAEVERPPDIDDGDLSVQAIRDLPAEAVPWLWPSRYCPSDRFEGFIERTFGGLRDAALIQAILDWVASHLDYRPGVSNSRTDAIDTFVDRAGVCRDYTHLTVSLLRASGVPARAVSAYAFSLEPPDMHAVVEAWVGGRWRLFDPTGRAEPNGLIRISAGADASHIAFMTIFGRARMLEQTFRIDRR